MIVREAQANEYKVIAGFQILMAKETENLILNNDTVIKGVSAVFEDKSKGQYYVAEEDGKTIASLLITYEWSDWRNKTVLWIQSVYVKPEYRGKGVYKSMYKHIKAIIKNNDNYAGVRLYVDKSNVKAQKVYDKSGMNGEHYKLYEEF